MSAAARGRRASIRLGTTRGLARRVSQLVQGYVAERIVAARHEQRDSRTLREATDDFHREFVLQALEYRRVGRRWNIMATAKDLDVSRNQIYALIERLGLRPGPASKPSKAARARS